MTHKKIIENFSYLSALQIFNIMLPLITYPYLIRVLGQDVYGLVVFVQAIIGYIVILIRFGFTISATKNIAIHRNDKSKLSEIVSSVLIIKSILFLLILIIFVIIVCITPMIYNYKVLFMLTMWMCIYEILFPTWYFQGIEQMKYITYITLFGRIVFLCLVFILINKSDDYLFIPIINAIVSLTVGFISLFIIFYKHKIKFVFQPIHILNYYFKESIPIFVSNVSTSLYVNMGKVLVGTYIGMKEVAYYDLAEKITNLFKMPHAILSQSVFPQINRDKNISFVRKLSKIYFILTLCFITFVLLFSEYFVSFLGGELMMPSVGILNIFILTVPIVAMSNIFGVLTLIPFGYSKAFTKVIMMSFLVYLFQIFLLFFLGMVSVYSISIILVITEIFVTCRMYFYCKKYNLWTKNGVII